MAIVQELKEVVKLRRKSASLSKMMAAAQARGADAEFNRLKREHNAIERRLKSYDENKKT